jgi:hypothetical protein
VTSLSVGRLAGIFGSVQIGVFVAFDTTTAATGKTGKQDKAEQYSPQAES